MGFIMVELVKNAPKKAKKAYKEFLEKQNQNIKL